MKVPQLGYVMLYIGYENIDTARICGAVSPDGITQWKRFKCNPLISPTEGGWDADACYKPSFLWNQDTNQWMLWYNGRKWGDECIGLALKDGFELDVM